MQPRILAIISYFYPFQGGAERQAMLVCKSLKARGFSACVLTRHFSGQQPREVLHGVPVYRSIHTLPWGKLFGISYFFSCLWFLIRERHSYDIIHCYILQGFHSPAAVIMKYCFKKKVIIRISATGPLSDFLLLKQGLLGGLLLRFTRKADRIITLCSQATEEALVAGFRPQQIVRIPNGIDTSIFTPSTPQPASVPNILFVGRLDSMKGVDILLKAVAELRDSGMRIFCTIVGDGPVKEDLQNYARALAIDDLTVFAGTCFDIVPRLQQASIFVLPSHSEGVPNVILEAMACALPIVATAVGGVPDIIQDGRNGLLVAPGDVRALSSALLRLHADYALARRLGDQARRDAEERYALDTITAAYIDLYQTLAPMA